AMPYKRNPMRCERATSLCRFVMSQAHCALDTAATQWLERTLDDSASRRLILPEAFLALDAVLLIMHNVASGLIVNDATVRANLLAELPFMASENLMMEAVALGRDRQAVHEAIRQHSQDAGRVVKQEGRPNDLIERLRSEPLLEGVDLDGAMAPEQYIGLAPQQVDRFIEEIANPVRARYAGGLSNDEDLKV
ncbi:MAG: adenylosuccinate lyase, partial [Phycisphaerales bacterium]|nr:adenylosuccinate lyase [Phycisphaerales bacterium]